MSLTSPTHREQSVLLYLKLVTFSNVSGLNKLPQREQTGREPGVLYPGLDF